MDERLKREGTKSHKQRVEEYNKYLSNLSEHHDMYVSPHACFADREDIVTNALGLTGRVSDLANTWGERGGGREGCWILYFYFGPCVLVPKTWNSRETGQCRIHDCHPVETSVARKGSPVQQIWHIPQSLIRKKHEAIANLFDRRDTSRAHIASMRNAHAPYMKPIPRPDQTPMSTDILFACRRKNSLPIAFVFLFEFFSTNQIRSCKTSPRSKYRENPTTAQPSPAQPTEGGEREIFGIFFLLLKGKWEFISPLPRRRQ